MPIPRPDSSAVEPTITEAEVEALWKQDPSNTELTVLEADDGRFLAKNKGISDDGKSCNFEIIARVVP